MGVDVGNWKLRLKGTDTATATTRQVHRFYNPGKTSIRFQIKILPAENGFLVSLCIGYGLAGDGKADNKGIPKYRIT